MISGIGNSLFKGTSEQNKKDSEAEKDENMEDILSSTDKESNASKEENEEDEKEELRVTFTLSKEQLEKRPELKQLERLQQPQIEVEKKEEEKIEEEEEKGEIFSDTFKSDFLSMSGTLELKNSQRLENSENSIPFKFAIADFNKIEAYLTL